MTAPARQLAAPPSDTGTDKAPPRPEPEGNAAASAAAAFAATPAAEQMGQHTAASFSFERRLLLRQQANFVEREAQEKGESGAPRAFSSLLPSDTRDADERFTRSRKRYRCLQGRREESFDSAVAEASDESTTERDSSVLLLGPPQAEDEPQQKRPCALGACKEHAGRVCDGVFLSRLADPVEARRPKLSERSSGADASH
ncbi:hypothetical protein Esti_002999 [Eimeria stiedai]